MKLRSFKDNDEAVLGYFVAFILSVTMLVFLFGFAIPFMTNFTVDMYAAGDDIIAMSEENLDNIQNATIRNRIMNNLQTMQDSTEETVNYLSFFYQYSWIFVIVIVVFTMFMLARKVVETKGMQVV